MPLVSQKQRGAMYAAKAGKSTLGIPKSVGAEFVKADPGGKLPKYKHEKKDYDRSGHNPGNPFHGSTPHTFTQPATGNAHGYGHGVGQRVGSLRLSGHSGGHRIGKR